MDLGLQKIKTGVQTFGLSKNESKTHERTS
jgi:hypothetical protein